MPKTPANLLGCWDELPVCGVGMPGHPPAPCLSQALCLVATFSFDTGWAGWWDEGGAGILHSHRPPFPTVFLLHSHSQGQESSLCAALDRAG